MKHLSSPRIALVRTGSACKKDSDPDRAKQWLAEHQLQADFNPRTQEWLSAEERAAILLEFILDDSYDVLWSFRGGEGTADILPYLEAQAANIKKAKPKRLIGFSDFIAFINYFNQRFSWPVTHGPGIMQLADGRIDAHSIETTLSLIRDPNAPVELNHLTPLNELAKQSGVIKAQLCGGNLSVLGISVKDLWEIQPANKIFIIEDVDERPHKIARTLNYLNRVDVFNGAKAVIFGDFIYHDPAEQEAIMRTLLRFASTCPVPVLHSTAFGHGKHNMPLPFYRTAELKLGDDGKLDFLL